nr:RNA polymerase II transcriptional coactivator KIWI-like [Ipomoea trifida]
MSKRFGKRKEDDDFASESNDRPKKTSKTDDSDDSDDNLVWEISKNRRVAVRNWQGKLVVDFREFYWKVLREHVEEIEKEVAAGE